MEFMLAGITTQTTGNIGILPLVTVSRARNDHRPCGDRLPSQRTGSRVRSLSARPGSSSFSSSAPYFSYSTPGSMCVALVLSYKRRRWHCVSTPAAFSERGGDKGFDGESGRDGSGGAVLKVELEAGASTNSSDVIILDVEGMMCEGCTSSVTKILEGQPQVSSTSVDLAMKTATVWPVADVKAALNWQKELGEELAKHLSGCGFKSSHRAIEEDT